MGCWRGGYAVCELPWWVEQGTQGFEPHDVRGSEWSTWACMQGMAARGNAYTFPCIWSQLSTALCVHPVFLTDAIMHEKMQKYILLDCSPVCQLRWNKFTRLEQGPVQGWLAVGRCFWEERWLKATSSGTSSTVTLWPLSNPRLLYNVSNIMQVLTDNNS